MPNYQEFFDQAPWWREQLDDRLKGQNEDFTASYSDIACTFPSTVPHTKTFDHPLINDSDLMAWAKERGWHVELEKATQPNELPCVLFTKLK